MYAEFSERCRSIESHAGHDLSVLETCVSFGFDRNAGGGLPILDRVARLRPPATIRARGDRAGGPRRPSAADGMSPAAGVSSFTEAARKAPRAEPSRVEPPPSAPVAKPSSPRGDAQEGYEHEENIVRSALGRLQAKVDEEIGDTDLEARTTSGSPTRRWDCSTRPSSNSLAMRKPELFVGAGSLLPTRWSTAPTSRVRSPCLTRSSPLHRREEVLRDVRYHKAVLLENTAEGGRRGRSSGHPGKDPGTRRRSRLQS